MRKYERVVRRTETKADTKNICFLPFLDTTLETKREGARFFALSLAGRHTV